MYKYVVVGMTPEYVEEIEKTDDWQKAIDVWSKYVAFSSDNDEYRIEVHTGDFMINLFDKESIKSFSERLIREQNMNRVQQRLLEEYVAEQPVQEFDGMETVEPKDYPEERYVDIRSRYDTSTLIGNLYCGSEVKKEKLSPIEQHLKDIDFHGDFENMSKEEQDAIVNPKHYKMIPKEAYVRFPEGLEYMDLMEYILEHHEGVEAHLLGQIFKYACRLGKKDAKLQDARKIEWYANRLVEVIENANS